MLQNVINSIIEAETEADNIVKDATAEAKENYLKAKTDSEVMIKNNSKDVKNKYRALQLDAQEVATKEYDKIIEEGKVEADKLLKDSAKEIDEAAKFIAGRLLEKYGNS